MRTKEEILHQIFPNASCNDWYYPVLGAMEKYATDKLENQFRDVWREMMVEDPVKAFTFFLSQMGQVIVDTNAGSLDLSAEMTLNGERYKVSCKAKAKKVKPIRPQNPEVSDTTDAP